MSTLNVNNIDKESGSNVTIGGSGTTVNIGASGQTTNVTGTLDASNADFVPKNPLSNRNRIINGDMRIDQRNAGASVTLNGLLYSVDRWGTQASQNSKATIQQSSTAPTRFTNSVVVTSSSAYSPLATDYFWLYQTIEGFNIADLYWGSASAQTVTLSFWVRSSLTGTFSVRLGSGSRSYVTTYTIASADTYEYKTVTIPGDTSGTWNTTNAGGIQVQFDLGSGSNRTTSTTNAWQAGDFQKATGSVSLVSTNGATFYITGVQLEVGEVATPFEHESYGQTLAKCQRYYEVLIMASNNATLHSYQHHTNMYFNFWHLKQTKRSSPTVSTGPSASWGLTTGTFTPCQTHVQLYATGAFFISGTSGENGLIADAEL